MTLDRTSATLVADEDSGVDEDPGGRRGLTRPGPLRGLTPDRLFWLGVAAAVALGALVRLLYPFHAAPVWVGGDGFDYHVVSQRLADGYGFTKSPDGVRQFEYAHHPPGWASVLGVVTQLGYRTMRDHQVTSLVIGL